MMKSWQYADPGAPLQGWAEIRVWRQAKRAELLSRREAMQPGKRQSAGSTVRDLIRDSFPDLRNACIGLYWPFRGEIDVRDLVCDFLAAGATAALPVVVEKKRPLEFWRWQPGIKLGRGIWDIPIPAERMVVRPTVLLVALLGFDDDGYRLGYGGGYYDRTLATMNPAPLTIGVGYEAGRLQTIYPQPHDVPLSAIVTEAGCTQIARRPKSGWAPAAHVRDHKAAEPLQPVTGPSDLGEGGSAYASPPCFMHEVDPAYSGYLTGGELLALLNQLLEAERAGARGVMEMAQAAGGVAIVSTLRDIAADEARFCAMLNRHIVRLGGTSTSQSGAFYRKLLSVSAFRERIDLLNRGQVWVVRKLQRALPKIADDALRRDLKDMLDVHQRNIQRCVDVCPPAA